MTYEYCFKATNWEGKQITIRADTYNRCFEYKGKTFFYGDQDKYAAFDIDLNSLLKDSSDQVKNVFLNSKQSINVAVYAADSSEVSSLEEFCNQHQMRITDTQIGDGNTLNQLLSNLNPHEGIVVRDGDTVLERIKHRKAYLNRHYAKSGSCNQIFALTNEPSFSLIQTIISQCKN